MRWVFIKLEGLEGSGEAWWRKQRLSLRMPKSIKSRVRNTNVADTANQGSGEMNNTLLEKLKYDPSYTVRESLAETCPVVSPMENTACK